MSNKKQVVGAVDFMSVGKLSFQHKEQVDFSKFKFVGSSGISALVHKLIEAEAIVQDAPAELVRVIQAFDECCCIKCLPQSVRS